LRTQFLSVAFSLDQDLVGIVSQTIEDGVGHQGIFKEVHPFLDMTAAGDHEGGGCVALDDQFVKILSLFGREFLKTEVVHDQERGADEAKEFLFKRVIRSTLEQSFEEQSGSDHQDVDSTAAGAVAQGIGEMGLTDSDGAAEEDIFVSFDEAEAEEVSDVFPIQGDGRLPVKPFKGLFGMNQGLHESSGQSVLFSSLPFVVKDQFEEGLVGELLASGIGHPVGQRGEQTGETQVFEDLFQFVTDFHGVPPFE